MDLLQDALLLCEDLEGHRQNVHERDARHEPQDLSALGAEDVEELVGAVDQAVDGTVLVILDELGDLRNCFRRAIEKSLIGKVLTQLRASRAYLAFHRGLEGSHFNGN